MAKNKVLLLLDFEYIPEKGIVIHHPSTTEGVLIIPCTSENEGLEKMYAAVEEANEVIRQSTQSSAGANPITEIFHSIVDIRNSVAEIAALVKK